MSLYHFDTTDANYSNDPYDCSFNLQKPIIKPKSIQLKSLEMPANLPSVRNGINTMTLVTDVGSYTITLATKNYTKLNDLLVDLNIAFTAALPTGNQLTFSVDSFTGLVKLNVFNNVVTAIKINSYKLALSPLATYMLGYRNVPEVSTAIGVYLTASVLPNLNLDNYIYMYVNNPGLEQINTTSNINCSFKIPFNILNGMIYYFSDTQGLKQTVNVSGDVIWTTFNVLILDRFGNKLTSFNSSDYSFSIEIN